MPEPLAADVLLVGGGVASVRCARTLRRQGFAGSIVLVGAEPHLPYNRPPLSKELLRGEVPPELAFAEQASWYERRSVTLVRGTRVTSLLAGERLAELDDGRRIRYRQCLLATGATPRVPPLNGSGHARLLRTLEDAAALRARAVGGGRAVVIGGGFIGVEVASSLAAAGMAVTVVELAPALWSGTLGSALSGWAAERLAAVGVAVRVDALATRLDVDAAWLGDERLPAEVLVAGVGVAPDDDLARRAGLDVADGILTDTSHATSADGVFAAGDVARVDGLRVEHWHAARDGGERAAMAMLGQPLPAVRAPWVFSEVAGIGFDVVGLAVPGDEQEVLGDLAADRFCVAWLRAGRLGQVAVVGGALPVDAARDLVEGGAGLAELREALD